MALCGRAALLVEALRVGFAVSHAEGAAGAREEPQRAPLRWGQATLCEQGAHCCAMSSSGMPWPAT